MVGSIEVASAKALSIDAPSFETRDFEPGCSSGKDKIWNLELRLLTGGANGPHNVTTFSFTVFLCDHRVHASRIRERFVLMA